MFERPRHTMYNTYMHCKTSFYYVRSRQALIVLIMIFIAPTLITARPLSEHGPFSYERFCAHLQKKITTSQPRPQNEDPSSDALVPWHDSFWSIGSNANVTSSFLPHRYTRDELAPKRGSGITIVLIDTGVVCFSIDGKRYVHPDLAYHYKKIHGCLSMIHMEPIYKCTHALNELIGSPLVHHIMLEQWITEWVIDNKITTMQQWVKMHAPHVSDDISKRALALVKKTANQYTRATIKNGNQSMAVIREFIPTPRQPSGMIHPAMVHGTHAYGLLDTKHNSTKKKNATAHGLCPHADIIMIRVYDDWGNSNKALLIKAVQKSIDLKADIVICTLKLATNVCPETPASLHLNSLLAKIPYSIAAAGNNGTQQTGEQRILSYPARFDAITFSVGAFGVTEKVPKRKKRRSPQIAQPIVPAFSQWEPGKGPIFLMPGVDIISTGVPLNQKVNQNVHPHGYRDKEESLRQTCYTVMSGTSSASVLFGGCLALLLAEAEGMPKDQIAYILQTSSSHLTKDWKKKSLHGTPDIRTALFLVRILKRIIERDSECKAHMKKLCTLAMRRLGKAKIRKPQRKNVSSKKIPIDDLIGRIATQVYEDYKKIAQEKRELFF